jgi:DNA-directed RNA polymerase I, II, and III subunit RPABC2
METPQYSDEKSGLGEGNEPIVDLEDGDIADADEEEDDVVDDDVVDGEDDVVDDDVVDGEDGVVDDDVLESDSERGDSIQADNSLASKLNAESSDDDENYESEESDDDPIDGKLVAEEKLNYIINNHTQEMIEDYGEIAVLANVTRNKNGDIIDTKHTTTPIMTKYEKTRILGLRISQLNNGARRLYTPENSVIDNNIIAEEELQEKILPFIISRPLPNGTKEHWRIQDLEIL